MEGVHALAVRVALGVAVRCAVTCWGWPDCLPLAGARFHRRRCERHGRVAHHLPVKATSRMELRRTLRCSTHNVKQATRCAAGTKAYHSLEGQRMFHALMHTVAHHAQCRSSNHVLNGYGIGSCCMQCCVTPWMSPPPNSRCERLPIRYDQSLINKGSNSDHTLPTGAAVSNLSG